MNNSMDKIWDFRSPGLKYGISAIDEIGYEAKVLGGSTALIVTDKEISKTGLTERIKSLLEEQGLKVEIWDDVIPAPTFQSVKHPIEFAKDRGIDLYVGLGSDNSIDTVKTINLILTHGGEILDYTQAPKGREKKVFGPCKPLIIVPTTYLRREATHKVVLRDPGEKVGWEIANPHMRPDVVIIDPLKTLIAHGDPVNTLERLMDSLTHAIEAYTTRRYDMKPSYKSPTERPTYGGSEYAGGNEVTDLFLAEAIVLMGKYLRRVVYQQNDLEARSGMMLASYLVCVAFSNAGLGGAAAANFPIMEHYSVPHGIATVIFLPAVVEFNLASNYEKYANIARFLGKNVAGLTVGEAAQMSVKAIKDLIKDVGVPTSITEFGVRQGDIQRLATEAMNVKRHIDCNPRQLITKDMENIYKKTMVGY